MLAMAHNSLLTSSKSTQDCRVLAIFLSITDMYLSTTTASSSVLTSYLISTATEWVVSLESHPRAPLYRPVTWRVAMISSIQLLTIELGNHK